MKTKRNEMEIKKRLVFTRVLKQQPGKYYCTFCGREVGPQQIAVFKNQMVAGGDYVCVCQLHKYLQKNSQISINEQNWEWKEELDERML